MRASDVWQRLVDDDALATKCFGALAGALVLGWAAMVWIFGATPAEDAFILFRYAAHLAAGEGIVWNPGEGPVEGATDFLWMLAVAGVTRLTGDPVTAATAVGLGFVAATLALYHAFFRRHLRLPTAVFGVVALAYLGTPVFVHVVNGFSPPMFAFGLTAVTALARLALARPAHFPTLLAWSLAMLLAGLTRPEGNVFNAASIAVVALARRRQWRVAAAPFLGALLLGYALPGLGYFAWRADYFGHAFPLPFYLKGLYGGSRLDVLWRNLGDTAVHSLVPMAVLGAALGLPRRSEASPTPELLAVPALALFGSYLLMILSQNVVHRFEYAPFAVLLFLAGARLGEWVGLGQLRRGAAVAAALLGASAWFSVSAIPIPERRDEIVALGQQLRPLASGGRTLATTEAGRLPFFSQWRTLDSYGLNDPVVAKGGFDYAHWRRYAPDLVLIHPARDWDAMQAPVPPSNRGNRRSLMEFMQRDGHWELVAVVKRLRRRGGIRPGDYNLYFVATTSPAFRELVDALTSLPGAAYADVPPAIEAFLRGGQRRAWLAGSATASRRPSRDRSCE